MRLVVAAEGVAGRRAAPTCRDVAHRVKHRDHTGSDGHISVRGFGDRVSYKYLRGLTARRTVLYLSSAGALDAAEPLPPPGLLGLAACAKLAVGGRVFFR